MTVLESLHRRQLGLHAFSTTCAAGVHQAKSFEGKLTADVGLLRRLACSAELDAHTGAVSSLAWNEDGLLLLSGGEDNKVRLWEPSLSRERACFALGHKGDISNLEFVPESSNAQMLSCSTDGLVKLTDLERKAIRTYVGYNGFRIRVVTAHDPDSFLTGDEGGLVLQNDRRTWLEGRRHQGLIVADQSLVHCGRRKRKIAVHSIAIDPVRPHLFVTGGEDQFVRLYDNRMATDSAQQKSRCIAQYAPVHLSSSPDLSRQSPVRSDKISGVAFAPSGREIIASYTKEHIYSFDVASHARDPDCPVATSRSSTPVQTSIPSQQALVMPPAPAASHAERPASVRGPPAPHARPSSALASHHQQQQQQQQATLSEAAQTRDAPSPTGEVLDPSVSGSVAAPSRHSHGASPVLADPRQPAASQAAQAPSASANRLQHQAAEASLIATASPASHAPSPLRRSARLRSTAHAQHTGVSVLGETAAEPAAGPSSSHQGHLRASHPAAGLSRLGKRKEREHNRSMAPPAGRTAQQRPGSEEAHPSAQRHDQQAEHSRAGTMQSDQDVLAGQASEQLPAGSMAGPRLPSGASGMVHVEEQRDHTPSMAASTRLAPGYSAGQAWHTPVHNDPDGSLDHANSIADHPLEEASQGRNNASSLQAEQQLATHRLDAEEDSNVGVIIDDRSSEGEASQEGHADGLFNQCFSGHCNRSTYRKVAVMGRDGDVIVSGSDDGHVFMWHRATGKLVNMLLADDASALCASPHPLLPSLATAGAASTVRIWSPEAEEPAKLDEAKRVMQHNIADLADMPAVRDAGRPLIINMRNLASLATVAAASAGRGPIPIVARAGLEGALEAAEQDHDDAPNPTLRCTIM